MITTVSESSFAALQRGALKAVSCSGNSSPDPELLHEAPLLLRLDTPTFHRYSWRDDLNVLVDACRHLADPSIIAARLRHHYQERLSLDALDATVALLVQRPFSKKAVLNIWAQGDLHALDGAACLTYIWFRRAALGLGVRAHMRACDIVKKLIADTLIFEDVSRYVADALNLHVAWLEIFVDCAHIYREDESLVQRLLVEV
jgi:hypothetical protein